MARRAAANQALSFEDRAHNEINDLDHDVLADDDNDLYDHDYDPDDASTDESNDNNSVDDDNDGDDEDNADADIHHPHDVNITGVNQNNNNHEFDNKNNDENNNFDHDHNDEDNDNTNKTFDNEHHVEDHAEGNKDETDRKDEGNGEDENDIGQNDPTADKDGTPDIDQIMDNNYGPRNNQYNMRPRKPRDYVHRHIELEDTTVMTQFNAKQGIQPFGEAGVAAIMKELQQLHDRKVMEPKNRSDLTDEDITEALEYLMFVSEKRNGTIKGGGCADGRKQRATTTKEEASSPTVAIESAMLSCVIDALEKRDVGIVDIPGAFMDADMDRRVHERL